MCSARRLLLTIGVLPLAFAGYFVTDELGLFESFYSSTVGPFMVMYWLGLMFSNMYVYLREDLLAEQASEGTIATVCGGLALVFFIAGGGPALLWRDTWMFGAAVMPGIDIAWPYFKRFAEARVQAASTAPASPSSTSATATPIVDAPPAADGSTTT